MNAAKLQMIMMIFLGMGAGAEAEDFSAEVEHELHAHYTDFKTTSIDLSKDFSYARGFNNRLTLSSEVYSGPDSQIASHGSYSLKMGLTQLWGVSSNTTLGFGGMMEWVQEDEAGDLSPLIASTVEVELTEELSLEWGTELAPHLGFEGLETALDLVIYF